MAVSCHGKVPVSSGREVYTIRLRGHATARVVYANCGVLVVFRHSGRNSHRRVKGTLMRKMLVAHDAGQVRTRGGSA